MRIPSIEGYNQLITTFGSDQIAEALVAHLRDVQIELTKSEPHARAVLGYEE